MSTTDFTTTHNRSRAPEYGSTPQTDTANEARQAVTGQGNGVVLAVSTGGVVLAFALIYAFFFA